MSDKYQDTPANMDIQLYTLFKEFTQFKPYRFQSDVANTIINGDNLILNAPTGSGKTYAAIFPFLFAKKYNLDFPQRVIYSLPLRTLANSLHKEISENPLIKELGLKVSLQTGEFPDDELFEADIIFTTIDQTLSSILGFPYSLSKRRSNMNAGAIIGSYLIFDEFHLLDPKRSMKTTLHILDMLKQVSRYCLMTATVSKETILRMNEFLGTASLLLEKDDLDELKNHNNNKKLHMSKEELKSDTILSVHHKKTIVLLNTVDHCQKLYLELKEKIKNSKKDIKLMCINSRFFKKDRQTIEKEILDYFGKDSKSEKDVILLSTQVIEVGIDISCDVMLTEISPINSFLQRIGRCARFEGENGNIFVFDVKTSENGSKSYLPYNEDLCKKTLKKLNEFDEKSITYDDALSLVNDILTKKEINDIENIKSFDISKFREIWSEPGEKSNGRDHIRDINTINVILVNPDVSNISSMFSYESISLNPNYLKNKLEHISETWEDETHDDLKLVSIVEEDFIMDDSELMNFRLKQISTDDLLWQPRVVLNPTVVKYSDQIGLNFFGEGRTVSSHLVNKKKEKKIFEYKKETYKKHVESMIKVYDDNLRQKHLYALKRMFKDKAILFDDFIKFMIILHDYGKLNNKWQEVICDFQKQKNNFVEGEFLAHSDFTKNDSLPEKLPPHATIGGWVAANIILDLTKNNNEARFLASSILNAISKHHSVGTSVLNEYNLDDKAVNMVFNIFNDHSINLIPPKEREYLLNFDTKENLAKGEYSPFYDLNSTFLYFLLSRILRLADTKSFDCKEI